jgi:predicted nucleic acid-binding protein
VSVFVDTSALDAILDADDAAHAAARRTFEGLRDDVLTTHAYGSGSRWRWSRAGSAAKARRT